MTRSELTQLIDGLNAGDKALVKGILDEYKGQQQPDTCCVRCATSAAREPPHEQCGGFMRHNSGEFDWTFEDDDLPFDAQSLEFTIGFNWTAGEPMVMYYRDGSGYPGSPDEVEYVSFECVKINDRKPTANEQPILDKWCEDFADRCEALRNQWDEKVSSILEDQAAYNGD